MTPLAYFTLLTELLKVQMAFATKLAEINPTAAATIMQRAVDDTKWIHNGLLWVSKWMEHIVPPPPEDKPAA